MKDQTRLLILYASQTGNSLDAAERIGREAERMACPAHVLSMDEFDANYLPDEHVVIFVVSTTGQGDNPDSMKEFWRYLLRRNLSQHWLQEVNYAVFGLGDSGYQKYNIFYLRYQGCSKTLIGSGDLWGRPRWLSFPRNISSFLFAAKKLDKRLSDLGAKAIVERGLGDDQHPSGYEGSLDPWLSSLWPRLYQMNPTLFPRGPVLPDPDMKVLDCPKLKIIYHDTDEIESPLSKNSDLDCITMEIERARSMSPAKLCQDKNKPHCFLKIIKNQQLTKEGCERDVRHFEFEALSLDIEYQVGDALEVLPSQNPAAVDAFIRRCNLNPDSLITVHPRGTEICAVDSSIKALKAPVKLKSFVELTMDIASASPKRYFFEVLSFFATAEHEKERLQYFASPEGRDDLYQYNQKERRTVLEVLEDFPSAQMPFEWLVQLVPPLKTRAFSISSSPSAHPNQVHLTVNVVSWNTPFKRKRTGLCSTWLAGLNPQERVHVPVWFQKGSLPPPSPSLPLLLIGPGTGCAPFRGFVEERAIQSLSGSTGPVLFFFGCRNEEIDFLYRDFWLSHAQRGGVLSEDKGGGFFVAFSREQPQKVYVQHKMQEESRKVWSFLSAGASVYVSGSSTKMPADVQSCLEEIIMKETGVSKEAAVRWLRAQEKAGKYHVEAWS